jgi:ATP-dependent Clp protease ATP-binding subunit ClpA/CheY-like chemotaxis protein
VEQKLRTSANDLTDALSLKLVGQPRAIASLVPYLEMHRVGLAPQGRPAGAFLLLGPSGTGKTRTVEAIAELLHGSSTHLLRIDCGEFQSEHEVAKLLGAPPGYVGHRESQPILTPRKLIDLTSPKSNLALILFDEIEKAAPSLATLLLGILDKAALRLGDGSVLNFENSLLFLTSNLGAREMLREMGPDIGFRTALRDPAALAQRLEAIGLASVRKRFTPEFVNRLDAIVTYDPLGDAALEQILGQHLDELQQHLDTRLGERSFELTVTGPACRFLLAKGSSTEYGARELKRTIHRYLVSRLASSVAAGEVPPGAHVHADLNDAGDDLILRVVGIGTSRSMPARKTVLVVDDNEALVGWLDEYLVHAGCKVLRASSVQEALAHVDESQIDAAFIDHLLPDGEGIELSVALSSRSPHVRSVIMTGAPLPEEDEAVCQRLGLPVLTKPFPAPQLLDLIDFNRRTSSADT